MKIRGLIQKVKFHHQITIIFILTAFWALIVMSAANIVKTRAGYEEKGKAALGNVAHTIDDVLAMQDKAVRDKMNSDFAAAESMITSMGKPILARGNEVEIELSSGETVIFPNLLFGYEIVTGSPKVLNTMQDTTGITASVFQVMDNGGLACTSRPDKGDVSLGQVVTDTRVLSAVEEGKPFLGVVKRQHGKPVLSGFHPLVDGAEGNVIGALHLEKDLLTADIVSIVQSSNVDGHGYGYITNHDGQILAHPELGAGTVIETDSSLVTRAAEFAPWGVDVGVAVPEADLYRGVSRQVLEVAGIGAGLVMIPVVIGLVLIGFSIRYATSGMSSMAQEIAQGNFAADFDYKARDAIGKTVHSMRNMAASLKEKLAYSQGLLSNLTIPCIVTDEQEKITFVNQPAMDLLEWDSTPEQARGMTLAEFFFGDASRKTIVGRAIRKQSPQLGIAVDAVSRKGTPFSISVDSAPVYDQDGEFVAAFVLMTVLTEIKNQQKEILAQNEQIERVAASAAEISSRLASASEEMAAQIEESSRGADEQQARASEVSTAIEQMTASVLEISQNSSDAAQGAESAKSEAEKGNQIIQDVVAHMGQIDKATGRMQESLQALGGDVEGIRQIMDIINDIADQTNLLALNAAIEAARAGETGRGFAVVADEVRKLAEKTMSATKDVGDAVARITEGTRRNIEQMDRAKEGVSETTDLAQQAGQSFQTFVDAAKSNSERIASIATAAEEQSTTSEQISQSTEEVNRTANETSVSMQEAAQAIADLNSLAQDLDNVVQDMQRA